jgi:hypothetical protein
MQPTSPSQSFSSWSLTTRWPPHLELAYFSLTLLVTFLVSFKLFLTHLFIAPLLILYITRCWNHHTSFKSLFASFNKNQVGEIAWLLFFIAVIAIECTFGFSPARSFSKLSSLVITTGLIFVARDFSKTYDPSLLIQTLIAGQVVTAVYSCSTKALMGYTPELFLGDVTHSGQLAIVIPIFLGYFSKSIVKSNFLLVSMLTSITVLSFLCFSHSAIIFAVWTLCLYGFSNTRSIANISLLVTCLCTNLKRGPWLGVGSAVLYLMFRWRPKLILPSLILITVIGMSIPEIRHRILEGQRDFNIAGGRKVIWQIGGELVRQYPMGIGFGNSRELRSYSYEIPPQHRHFHNNFLNIAVETGWPGILIFIIWIGTILRTIGSLNGFPMALLANQMAGLVEYNFGDSEILMILFICLGIYLGERENETQ